MRVVLRGLPGWTLLALALATLAASATGAARATLAPPAPARVDPRVIADTAAGGEGRFLVGLRAQADVRSLAAGGGERIERAQRVVAGLRRAADAAQPAVAALLNARGARYQAFWIGNLLAVEGDRELVDALAARPDVAWIESDRAFRVPLEEPAMGALAFAGGIQPNLTQVGAPALWAVGLRGQGIVYANADTGVMWQHPALIAQYRGWDGISAHHDYNWWDAITSSELNPDPDDPNPCGYSSPRPCDDHGHGTHVMGIGVGADPAAGEQIGVAPGARWIACRNMDRGVGRPSTYIACLQFFLAPTDLQGQNFNPALSPDVISNSYSCPPSEGCAPYSLQTAVEAVRAAGIFMAVAAGNTGPGCETVDTPPALEAAVFTVGAVDRNGVIAAFSSRGPVTVDGSQRLKPQITAPGVWIRSSYSNGGYTTMSGTSMAAPHVAGVVALLWSGYPGLRGDVVSTVALLEVAADPRFPRQTCGDDSLTSVPNNVYGNGTLDAYRAYTFLPERQVYYFPIVGR